MTAVSPPIVDALAHDKAEVLKEVELMLRDLAELSKDCEEFVYKHRLKWGHGWRTVKENVDSAWRVLLWARDELNN